jgi:coenzyme F420-reducing hydrogenase delta subunit
VAREGVPGVITFGCRGNRSTKELRRAGAAIIEVACMGQLPPSVVDYVLSRKHAEGVLLLGCENGDCNYRLGAMWTEQRIGRKRDPQLRRRIDASKIALGWQSPWCDTRNALEMHEQFRNTLADENSVVDHTALAGKS